ncbi:MAG TPA: aldose 1-epimerase [Puia sp.]|jgi:aldose 1-epimerase|nr:aldose 1-epimerase [Puia sp.]
MSFTITRERDEDLDLLQITDFTTGIQVRILPDAGALLHEFSIPLGNRRIQVIDNYNNLADLKKNHSSTYKSAKLSPFVCRISEGKYKFEGSSFEFPDKFNDGSSIHGILSDKPFTILEKKNQEDQAFILLEYHYKKENHAYPFEYLIKVKYTLKKGGRLNLETTVKNLSPGRIPMADGWHPYFSLEGEVNDWLLSFHSRKNLAFNEKLIPTGEIIETDTFYSPRLIGNERFDHCFLLESDPDLPAATLENPANGLRLSFFPDYSYPYLQIYTPDDRRTIAIENLSSAPDSFNNGQGLIILEPGASQSFSVLYQLEFR